MLEPIPSKEFPVRGDKTIGQKTDLIVSLSRHGFLCEPMYYKQKIDGALEDCYVRQALLERLRIAESYLPHGYRLKIWDGYRPMKVQQALWDNYRAEVLRKNPGITEEKLYEMTSYFVSPPSYDVKHPSAHNTGGAVDLTIVDENGNDLDMGATFDDFSPMSWSNYYEINDIDDKIRDNRRLLYFVMEKAGFTNLPSEFWHYDYGDSFWAYYTKEDTIYYGVLNTTDEHFKKMGI